MGRSSGIGLLLAGAMLLGPGAGVGQEGALADPAAVGMSAERLARIGPAMQAYVDRGEVAGVVTLVARDEQIVHLDARGFADREAGRALDTDALFRLASQTKPVTAVAVMILLEQGRLRLDDPVARYLPAYAGLEVAVEDSDGTIRMVPQERPMTIRHLLTHTAGMSGGDSPAVARKIGELAAALPRAPAATLESVVDDYARLALGFQPGTRWEYSPGAGFNVLGRIVEVVSGQSLWDFMREQIFEPLRMHDTFYYLPEDRLERYTVGYQRGRDGAITPVDPADGSSRFVRAGRPQVMFPGAGGLVSTVHDYLRFARMLLRGGELDGARVLSPKTVELMTAAHAVGIPKIGALGADGTAFGLGVNVVVDPAQYGEASSKDTYMWGGAFGTTFWIDPEERLIGLYMMQLQGHQPLRIRGDYRALVYGAVVE